MTVSLKRRVKTSNDVWRAERRCRGDDVNMVMMARDEVPSGRKGTTSTAGGDRRRLGHNVSW